ncbi:MAG: DEAD/DEAH box helicase family protein [Anaerolineales bacterium]|nr:DEAD/DEAH box helicase family protein [Anaerolineales bacterium]
MQLKFDANQAYQLDAIQAVTDLFDGQPRIETELHFITGAGQYAAAFAAVPNRLDISPANLLTNLHLVQARNAISLDLLLETLEAEAETLARFGNGNASLSPFYNFSVEMETGTGKTYIYLRTILELYLRYGMRKFIVVTPSIAIRQGVLKTLQITRHHFQSVYGNLPCRYYVYDSANLSQVRQFALSDGVEIMIMTLAAFNKAGNVIHQTTDRLQGETPIHLVQATRPVLILDEPQNMESEKSIAALAALHPLLALRYSATHRNPYNLIYRLTPFEAYRQGLVKRIEVASVVKEDDLATPYIGLHEIKTQKKTITARMKVFKRMRSGSVMETIITVRPGDSLEEKTGRSEYSGFGIEEIHAGYGFVRFSNNLELQLGEEMGADKEAIFEAQIRYTIEEHLRKQERLRQYGIKVLSLFFIDRVDNYAPKNGGQKNHGLVRRLFNQSFDELKASYPIWKDRQAEEIQAGYFAQRRTRSGEIILEDSASGEAEKDREAYELIMNAKERLLSFSEPVAFIFSHSALREGWDNPNVFQICTLNQSISDVRKRQEVGRGVRLAVNQGGEREREERVNVLTVVANESYEKFVAGLQSEIALEYQQEIEKRYKKSIADLTEEERAAIAEEYGEGILPPKPADARKRGRANLRKEYTLRAEFKELWDRIKYKTRYAVTVDSQRLVKDVVKDLGQVDVQPPRVTISKVSLEVREESVFYALQTSAAKSVKSLAGRYPLPNLVELMSELMQHTTPPVRLTRKTLLDIVRALPEHAQREMLENPHEFAAEAVRAIKTRLADQLVEGIRYLKINEWYEMSQFDTEIESWQAYLEPAQKAIYDQVVFDSEVERKFVRDLENMTEVKLYVKLPGWFTVPTPIGEYNPDWAIVWQTHDEHGEPSGEPLLYLVAETKSTVERDQLRPDEARKIDCGERHFREALGVKYEVVTSAGELGERVKGR